MLHEIHEGLGVLSVWLLAATSLFGLAAFLYAQLKTRVHVRRQSLVKGHGALSGLVVVALAAHILTTDRYGALVIAGALLVCAPLLVGLSFRISRRHFRPAVRGKVALLAAGSLLLLVGHARFEDDRKEGDEHQEHPFLSSPARIG